MAPCWPSSTGMVPVGTAGMRFYCTSTGSTLMCQPPLRTPAQSRPTSSGRSMTMGLHPTDTWQTVRKKMLSRDNWRRVGAPLLELQDSLRRRWDNL